MMKLSFLLDKLIWFFTLILFLSFYIFETNTYSRFILLGITAILFALILIRYPNNFLIKFGPFHGYILAFAGICFLSILWSIDPQASIIQTLIIVQIFICMSVLYLYYARQSSINPLFNIIMWGGYFLTLYTFKFYGLSNISYIFSVGGRLNNAYSNINTIALLVSFSLIITIYRILFDKFKWYHLFAILNIILIAATGSKKAFICLVFAISMLMFMRYSSKNWLASLINYLLVGIALLFLFRILLELPIFSGLNKRMETMFNLFSGQGVVDESTFLRQWMIRIGWTQFLETPLLGAGIGSSGAILLANMGWSSYMHNNYIELLSGLGIIGTAIYYSMFLWPGFKLFRQRKSEDKNTLLCLIFLITLLIMDVGAVSYFTKQTYFYLMIFFIQVQINQRILKEKANG